jgi:hypothetical protein
VLYRCFGWLPKADPQEPGGALYLPRDHQGAGRHDNPDLYGALYLSESPVGAVAEQLARFRGIRALEERHLRRFGRPLALASFALDEAALVDLDDPRILQRRRLRPSDVATGNRGVTQRQAAALYASPEAPAGIRWWSSLEASWLNVTLFDRALESLELADIRALTLQDESVDAATEFLGFR